MRIDPIELTIESTQGASRRSIPIGSVSSVRFAARDIESKRRDLDEMIARQGRLTGATRTNPSVIQMGRYLLTQSSEFEVQGTMTGGEAEVVAIQEGGDLFISVGSDHVDRELDPIFPDKPKQMCPHPIASTAWPYGEVRDHWDSMMLYSHLVVGGHTVPNQGGPVSEMVDLEFLLAMDTVKTLARPMVLFCGSGAFQRAARAEAIRQHGLPAETAGGVGEEILVRLHDPVLDRTIEHRYRPIPLGDDLAERVETGPA